MRFAGYAALFDRVDRGGDVVRAGAFRRAVGRRVPLLSEHRAGAAIGTARIVGEDRRGLRVIADASVPVERGMGLSFGYRVRSSPVRKNPGGKSVLDEQIEANERRDHREGRGVGALAQSLGDNRGGGRGIRVLDRSERCAAVACDRRRVIGVGEGGRVPLSRASY